MAAQLGSSLLAGSNNLAIRESLASRQDYRGGWPLGYTGADCPTNVSTECTTSSGFENLNCCPDDQACLSSLFHIYCCPTESDCESAVKNRPACANPDWKLYSLESYGYFCCPGEYVGVLPVDGKAGLCETNADGLPKSRLAKLVATTAPADDGGSTSTQSTSQSTSQSTFKPDDSLTTIPNAGRETDPSDTNPPGGLDTENPMSNDPKSGQGMISSGAIAGITIGGIILIALCAWLLLWYHRRSLMRNRHSKLEQELQHTNSATSSGPRPYQQGLMPTMPPQSPEPTPPPPPQYSTDPGMPTATEADAQLEVANGIYYQGRSELRDTQRARFPEIDDTQPVYHRDIPPGQRAEMPAPR